jgi:hypothetical protein
VSGALLLGILIGYSVGTLVIVVAATPDTCREIRMAIRYPQKRKRLAGDIAIMALIAVVWPVFLADKIMH